MTENGRRDRTIKVENIGDGWKGQVKPRIRLKGYWLKDAGIFPDNFVTISNPENGVLVIRINQGRQNHE